MAAAAHLHDELGHGQRAALAPVAGRGDADAVRAEGSRSCRPRARGRPWSAGRASARSRSRCRGSCRRCAPRRGRPSRDGARSRWSAASVSTIDRVPFHLSSRCGVWIWMSCSCSIARSTWSSKPASSLRVTRLRPISPIPSTFGQLEVARDDLQDPAGQLAVLGLLRVQAHPREVRRCRTARRAWARSP